VWTSKVRVDEKSLDAAEGVVEATAKFSFQFNGLNLFHEDVPVDFIDARSGE